MFTNAQSKSHTRPQGDNTKGNAWERFVAACTHSLGGFYRPDGTIFRGPRASHVGRDLDFADLTQRTHLRLRHQETLRQSNLETITQRAYEQVSAHHTSRQVDKDWLSLFFSYAQDINNTSMQELWACALAQEMTQPGCISKHSLAFLRHCDAWELAAFRKVTDTAFIAANGHPFIFRAKSHVSNNDPIFTEPRLLSHCISAGLFDRQTTPVTEGFKFTYAGQYQVVQQNPFSGNDAVGYYIQRLTRTGSDLYQLLTRVGLQTPENAKKAVVWDFLADYLELGIEQR